MRRVIRAAVAGAKASRAGRAAAVAGVLLGLSMWAAARAADSPPAALDISKMLAAAKPGGTISLPAGTFRRAIVLPAGVSLRGAGHQQTIIETGAEAAAVALSGEGSRIEDLAIRTQGTSGVSAENATGVVVRRVRIEGGAIGVRFEGVSGGRIENTIVSGNMTGVALNGVKDSVIVNCTLFRNSAIGMSICNAEHVAAMNNIVAEAGTGVVVGGTREQLAVDHNLYVALYVGKVSGSPGRLMLGPWRDASGGLDAGSVQLPVEFADAARGDFRPISRLDWAPDRLTTSAWGVAELAGFKAPEKDIDGAARSGGFDVGAYQSPPLGGPPPDGTLTIAGDAGTKSAGLFTRDGRLVRYLFHDLPLKKGHYGYVLPTRTYLGGPIEAGDYEVRVVESQLGWNYRGITANSGLAGSSVATDTCHTGTVCFAPDGSLLLGVGWNERGENLRSRDLKTGKTNWVFRGTSQVQGLCVAADGFIYFLREAGKGQSVLSKIDPASGQPAIWADLAVGEARPGGMTELGGTLFIADSEHGRMYRSALDRPALQPAFDIPAPASPSADRKRKLIWLVSGQDKVLAVEPSGKVRTEFTGVPKPLAVAVGGDRLAVASQRTGKIHLLDCSNPGQLKPIKTIGRGDGPWGPALADRFLFQQGPYNNRQGIVLDLNEEGWLAVKDHFARTIVFDLQGKAAYCSFAQFGNFPLQAQFAGDGAARFFDSSGSLSWFVDARAGTWQPDAYWGHPSPGRTDAVGFFSDSGKLFGIYRVEKPRGGILIVRFENYVGRPLACYTQEQVVFPPGSGTKRDMWVVRHETNHDGQIDEQDAPGTPVLDTEGKPVQWQMTARFLFALPDGSLCSPTGVQNPSGLGYVWKRKGLDREGVPAYEFGPGTLVPVRQRTVPSAYDFSKTEDLGNMSECHFAPNGDFLATFQFGHSPNGMGFSNSGGVDVARIGRDGQLRWLRPMNAFGPIQGVKPLEKFILTSWGHQAEWIGMDPNGLGLGHLGFPPGAGWEGYWVDHPNQYLVFTGNDGRLHVLVGDYMQNCQHWLTLENYDNYRSASFPVTIGAARARALASSPAVPFRILGKAAQPRITIRRLSQPLPIDGKLAKWRAAGITPQIVITPVTATNIESPKDCSAVVRLAYLNQDLYVQVLRFDDVVSFHQPHNKSHLQDTVEMMLNGFMEGFQFSISRFTDTGPTILRRRFFFNNLELAVGADHAPRVIEVLDNAKAVSERRLIESIYGVDMSDCKVIVSEFKLPIDKVTYQGGEQAIFPMKHGSGVWLGFAIDDNDVPGTDVQRMMVWPANFNTFAVKEAAAWAEFE